jgi:hypothetical protein
MVLRVRRKGPGVPDELYVDFDLNRDAGWKGPYPLSTSVYDLMIDRQRKMKRWNEYGTDDDESESTDTSTDDEESSSSEGDEEERNEVVIVEGTSDDEEEDTPEPGNPNQSSAAPMGDCQEDKDDDWTECWPSKTGMRRGNPKRDYHKDGIRRNNKIQDNTSVTKEAHLGIVEAMKRAKEQRKAENEVKVPKYKEADIVMIYDTAGKGMFHIGQVRTVIPSTYWEDPFHCLPHRA